MCTQKHIHHRKVEKMQTTIYWHLKQAIVQAPTQEFVKD